jgi:hypothetical protein
MLTVLPVSSTVRGITVGTGGKKQEFTIHKRILCEKSEFLEELDGNVAEVRTNTINSPEGDPRRQRITSISKSRLRQVARVRQWI